MNLLIGAAANIITKIAMTMAAIELSELRLAETSLLTEQIRDSHV